MGYILQLIGSRVTVLLRVELSGEMFFVCLNVLMLVDTATGEKSVVQLICLFLEDASCFE